MDLLEGRSGLVIELGLGPFAAVYAVAVDAAVAVAAAKPLDVAEVSAILVDRDCTA